MSSTDRETHLVDVFTTLADTLVAEYDVVDLLQTVVETSGQLFDVSAAGILLADDDRTLDIVASSSESLDLVEVLEVGSQAGPCLDCFTSGKPVLVTDLVAGPSRWRDYESIATRRGFRSSFAIPLRLRSETVGTLTLLRDRPSELAPRDLRAAQALADVATVGILHERTARQSALVQEQLQKALGSRIVIEQAKGVLSETLSVSTDDAFEALRSHARRRNLKLADVARDVVSRRITL
ncbi:GAF and ANTAR domain-containing protein [Frigoribacterium sp. Leaf172]|uniref:GAF and ANTAR domain-containing protein n=1 Tax=Frigoribacterium sp. Leaf172 TaxID=1736285 RepID=UPI0006F9A6A9|nr:GAF and ANTAR domain-containing protein [Frigoribacterium sp. Leaf172]KQR63934.1 transcriptional regulator [Frigoribacterium sp. Leaf172]